MGSHRRFHIGNLGFPPDEAGDRGPQVSRARIQCPQRRKVRAQPRRTDLKRPTEGLAGPATVAAPDPPDQFRRAEPPSSRPPGSDRHARQPSPAQRGLAPSRSSRHPAAPPHRSQCPSAPATPAPAAPRLQHRRPSAATRTRQPHRNRYGWKTVVRLNRGAQHLVMVQQGCPHGIRVGFPPTGRPLNIGEQKRHHPRRSSRPISGHPRRISQPNAPTSCIGRSGPLTRHVLLLRSLLLVAY
jgi:hypothetical protein